MAGDPVGVSSSLAGTVELPTRRERVFRFGSLLAIVALAVLLGCMLNQAGGISGLSDSQKALAVAAIAFGVALIVRMFLPAAPVMDHSSVRVLAGACAVVLPLAMAALLLTTESLQPACVRGLLYTSVAILEAISLTAAIPGLRSETALGLAMVAPAMAWSIASFAPALSAAPFSLGWSEASRYYYASLFVAPAVYGQRAAWPVLHASRYLLQALPFLIGDLPIAAHRLWQVVLWVGMTAAVAATLAWRWIGQRSWRYVLLVGWAFLFLLQGPVYYHLALGVLPLLIGFRWDRPRRNLALVILGSAWAGLSRVNWYPVPGLLASALLALESPAPGPRHWSLRDWRWPAVWVALGGLAALAAGIVYARLSGNSLDQFGSSFASDLLWYRLLPNATYPPGVLPAVVIASLPLALVILASVGRPPLSEPYRLVLLGGILAVLFIGGLVVSVKIGGGGDLHNMDAFLMLLLVSGGSLWTSWPDGVASRPSTLRMGLAALALIVPAGFAMVRGQPLSRVDVAGQRAALAELRERLAAVDGPVLFLTQRHLLTFAEIEVPLVEPYEKVHLMEMAMSRNPGYLAQFRRDLEAHRFQLIVSDALNANRQGSQHPFGEENDAWADAVVIPLLDNYQVEAELPMANLRLLTPKDD